MSTYGSVLPFIVFFASPQQAAPAAFYRFGNARLFAVFSCSAAHGHPRQLSPFAVFHLHATLYKSQHQEHINDMNATRNGQPEQAVRPKCGDNPEQVLRPAAFGQEAYPYHSRAQLSTRTDTSGTSQAHDSQ